MNQGGETAAGLGFVGFDLPIWSGVCFSLSNYLPSNMHCFTKCLTRYQTISQGFTAARLCLTCHRGKNIFWLTRVRKTFLQHSSGVDIGMTIIACQLVGWPISPLLRGLPWSFEHTFPWPTEDAHRDFVDPGACHEPPSDHNYYLSSETSEHLQNGLAPSCALSFMVPRWCVSLHLVIPWPFL